MSTPWKHAAAAVLFLFAHPSIAPAQNRTVGDDMGGDHIAFNFAPYRSEADRGEGAYRDHVGTGAGSGQQYGTIAYEEVGAPPAGGTTICTLSRFYTLIHDETAFLGTLLITTHGATDAIAVEAYALSPAGMASRDARFDAYRNGTTGILGLPAFTAAEIQKCSTAGSYAICATATFIRNHGRLTQGLVYVAACCGHGLTDDFVAADARVSVGNSDSPTPATQRTRVTTFFRRMDGQETQAMRPVSQARVGLSLDASGNEATTLAPSVLSVTAPCPISVNDTVTYHMDTECEQGILGDIVGMGCTIEMETWIDATTLRGVCTAVTAARDYRLTLEWNDVYSDANVARLDGNVNPAVNARGPAHDNHVSLHRCPEPETCLLILGLSPTHQVVPGFPNDILLVEPQAAWPVTMGNVPPFPVPTDPALLGAHFYFQVGMYNPAYYGDPLKLSRGLDCCIGQPESLYGPSSGLQIWTQAAPMPGTTLQIGWAIGY